MGPISKAIDEVKFRIPRRILEEVFLKRNWGGRGAPISLDEEILKAVVRPRVLVDCNLVGGTEAFIPLDGVPVERANDYTSVYRIPKDRTQGRTIISALNVTFSDPTRAAAYGYGTAAGGNYSIMQNVGQGVMDAHGAIPVTSTASVQLIAENTVMVRDTTLLPANIFLRCVLANDENMSHIQIKSYREFAKLVEHAVKAYIYNTYIVEMDMGQLVGGQNLGVFKEIVTGYADEEDLYQTFLAERWQKVAFMNDRETYNRFLKMKIGGYR